MRHEARFTAYDVLDQVQVALTVYVKDDDDPTVVRKALVWARQYPSRGETDPTTWARQLLEQAFRDLEATEKRPSMRAAAPAGPHTVSDVADTRKSGKA